MNREAFFNPALEYRMKTIVHAWPEKEEVLMDAIRDFGYGGVATNPSQDHGYTSNPENLEKFDETLKNLQKKNLAYWIYDEKGYPSGYAGGLALEEHPELEAKGFYMVRRLAVQPKHSVFHLDDESDKIVWAAKYPVDHSVMNASIIEYEEMEAVPFTDTYCECDLKENEAFFIFCVKSAYEGSHLTHNVCSRSRYINILDQKAVRRFLDVCYEPIVQASPDAYRNACAVFTDEPSLVTAYIQGDEVWPYALAPWKEGLFEDFEREFGYSILPYLPQIFEGRESSYTTRVHFYQLIGKLAADAYVTQISRWCHEHGGKFSGHYLAEESLKLHVLYYGSYLEVLKATDYPGVDVLAAYPKIYHYNTTRFAQMAARKKGINGLMTELCPFIDIPYFEKEPVRYATGILNLLYLGGCRCINSYFSSDFASHDPEHLSDYHGYMSREQARWVNDYVGRIGYMLDGVQNDCGAFVYYALEDVQAKTRPEHCAQESSECDTDRSLLSLTRRIYEAGHDYLFADREDIVNAAKSAEKGCAEISGIKVENIILPAMDVIWPDAWEALETLKKYGVNVWFAEKIPTNRVGDRVRFEWYDFREESVRGPKCAETEMFKAMTETEILCALNGQEQELKLSVIESGAGSGSLEKEPMILKARYRKAGKVLYFVVNNSEADVKLSWSMDGKTCAQVWDPADGTVREIRKNEILDIVSYQGKFLMAEE
ncbi:MAG: hypothetical protein Q4C91_04815 [Eubacteriales bacterium]|nr:hypothetical protein [Eubacteriales bacterium]